MWLFFSSDTFSINDRAKFFAKLSGSLFVSLFALATQAPH
jgi:hypothetical protein